MGTKSEKNLPASDTTSEVRLDLPSHVRSAHNLDGGSVLDLHSGQIFRLNSVGSKILEFMKRGLVEREIASELVKEFSIDPTVAQADLREFLQMLQRHQLFQLQIR